MPLCEKWERNPAQGAPLCVITVEPKGFKYSARFLGVLVDTGYGCLQLTEGKIQNFTKNLLDTVTLGRRVGSRRSWRRLEGIRQWLGLMAYAVTTESAAHTRQRNMVAYKSRSQARTACLLGWSRAHGD